MDTKLKLCTLVICSVVSTSLTGMAGETEKEGEKGVEKANLTQLRAQITVAQRTNGPFGLSQDLSVKKVARQAQAKPELFPKAIAAIRINMVSVSGGSFFIGFEEIKKGEAFPLEYGKNKFMVRVSSIEKGQITFENMDTQEQVIKHLDALPVGVQRGEANLEAIEGVTPASEQKTGVIRVGAESGTKKK